MKNNRPCFFTILAFVLLVSTVSCTSAVVSSTPTIVPTATIVPTTTPASTLEAGDSEHPVTVNGMERTYLLHVPPGLDRLRSVAVVFAFHGGDQEPSSMATMTGFDAVSNEAGFLIVFPKGIGLSWNAGKCCGDAQAKNIDDIGFVREIISDLGSIATVDTKRIYATGFSTGGDFVYRLGCEVPDTFAAVAAVGGALNYSPCQPAEPISLMDIHGLKDEFAYYNGGGVFNAPPVEEVIHTWAGWDGCTGSPQVEKKKFLIHTAYISCKNGAAVELYAIETGGHVWPLKVILDGAQTIWDFFDAHAKP